MYKLIKNVFFRFFCRCNFLYPILLTALAFLLFPVHVYARGDKDIVTQTADGIEIWQTEFDVSHRKKGTYNIIITAKDAAGNEGISGPYNIKVDPMAGLPEARIIYPEPGQIMRGDINIVGVATGRYGLKEILVKIDDEEYVTLEGNDYWYHYVRAWDLVEGKHTIRVKAIDDHDLVGPEVRVDFILDVTPPAIDLVGHEIGDLIAGSVKIKGTVYDANEIKSLEISTDGTKFSRLASTKKRGDEARHFQFPIRSKKMEDGPVVYYIRAVNKTGNAITKPFLFFVNNFPPQIEILTPELREDTFGKTQVTGRVISAVGLTEFYYEWAREKVEIPLVVGDPFWTVSFPISMANNRAIPFRVTAVDKSGNATTVTQRFQDTRRNRTPAIAIDYPPQPRGLDRINLASDEGIYGHIMPGFFPYAIMIEGEIEYVMAQPSFRIPPELIPEGRNTMRLWAIDEDDVTGPAFTLRVNKASFAEGNATEESPLTIDSPEEYDWFGDSVTIRGFIDDYQTGYTLEYRMSWDDSWKPVSVNARGGFTAVISLADLPEGAVPLEFRTARNGKRDIPYYFPLNKFITLPVIRFLTPDTRFGTIHGVVTTAGVVDTFVPLTQISYSIDGSTFEDMDFAAKSHRSWFSEHIDYSALHNHDQQLIIRVVDRAGNRVEASPEIIFDNSDDFPTVILNSPLEDELITGAFDISGLAYDDDGIAMVYWRILTPRNPWDPVEETMTHHRDVEFNRFETEQNFLIPVEITDVRDGENILEIFAEDIYGVANEVIRRTFRVSTAPPDTVIREPALDTWNRGNIIIHGLSYDLNGVESILVSMDNGVSYQKADFVSSQTGPSRWTISLNTKAYADGVYSMLIRSVDSYGISSFSNGIVNIDNTPPEIDLGAPRNGDKIGVSLPISGQVYDNLGVSRISLQFVNIENPNVQRSYDLPNEFVIMEDMDVSAFPDGDYTLKISVFDQAENETSLIRDVNILKARAAAEIALINPLPGIVHHGPLVVSGKITGAVVPDQVTLLLNRRAHTTIDVDRYGIFRYEMPEGGISSEDEVVLAAYFTTPSGERIVSFNHPVKVEDFGPVLVIDSHHDGDVITRRPWISGRAFYVPSADDIAEILADEEAVEAAADRASRKAARKTADAAVVTVKKVELSYDNGRSFFTARGTDEWRYRLETGELPPGSLPIVIKATFSNDSVAIRRIFLVVDTRAPMVHTIGPPENSAHRTAVLVYGSSSDDYDMDSVQISLRPGDKNLYQVPAFIQGLYFDASFLGGLQYMTGMGLTFFDDNVKVQFNASQAAPGTRYSGWAFGTKILANVFTKNLSEWFGPDWEFYTTSLTLGAHFSYFLMEEGETPLWMGEFLGQWEMIKSDMSFMFPKWKYFKSISLYTEPGIWFAPSDVVSAQAWRTKFTIAFGTRISLF